MPPRLALAQKPSDTNEVVNDTDLDRSVQKVLEARSALEDKLKDYALACVDLRDRSRRDPNRSSGHIMFAGMNLRLAGAVTQALKRSTLGDKLLERSLRERREELEKSESLAALKSKASVDRRRKPASLLPAHDDFDVLFGEESSVV